MKRDVDARVLQPGSQSNTSTVHFMNQPQRHIRKKIVVKRRSFLSEGALRSLYYQHYAGAALLAENCAGGVECRLHRVNLSGSYVYDQLTDALGDLWVDGGFDPSTRGSNYASKGARRFPAALVEVQFNRVRPVPQAFLSVFPNGDVSVREHRNVLIRLLERLPELNVSSVEFAADLFCVRDGFVGLLFYSLLGALYVPYQKYVRFYDEEGKGGGAGMNEVARFGPNDKVYERGCDDRKQIGGGWRREDLDRVRVEHTAKRVELKNLGIRTLVDLIAEPKFAEISSKWWKLSEFRTAQGLPAPYDEYISSGGAGGIFQREYRAQKKRLEEMGKQISPYRLPSKHYGWLQDEIDAAAARFDERWRAAGRPRRKIRPVILLKTPETQRKFRTRIDVRRATHT